MSSDYDAVIASLMQSAEAPDAADKLRELQIDPETVQHLIKHLSQIPGVKPNPSPYLDVGPVHDVVDLDSERAVFMHIPRCGGSTLHNILVNWYGPVNLHSDRVNGLYYYSARNLASKKLFSGHYDYYATQLVPGNPRLMVFLRDPRDRLISLYHIHRAHREELIERRNLVLARWANQYDINEYFAHPEVRAHPAINNAITRHLSSQPQLGQALGNVDGAHLPIEVLRDQAIGNLANFDFIGLMQHYDISVARLAKLLGKQVPAKIAHERNFDTLIETDPNMKRIDRQIPNAKTHALLDELVCEDEIVYEFAVQLFENIDI